MSGMPEMVERIAEMLAAANSDRDWPGWEDNARLVIQAMRRPSPAMIEAGIREAEDSAHHGMGMQRSAAESLALGLFDAMMEAALAAPDEGGAP